MIYEYNGYSVHQTGIQRFYVIGYNLRGWFLSINEAVKLIDGIVFIQCDF